MTQDDIISKLLDIEHKSIAYGLALITETPPVLDEQLAIKTIGLLDSLSRKNDDQSKRKIVTLSALLWTYKRVEWTSGLKDILLLILSRSGFAPSTRMIDDGFSVDTDSYSPMGSIFNQFAVALHHYQYEIMVANKTYTVTKFQKEVWEKLRNNIVLGISAPTSAGKSFIILLKAIELLHIRNTTIVYIVPTLSLVSQVYTDFKKKLSDFKLDDVKIYTNADIITASDTNRVFILTQEKAISAFSYNSSVFNNTRLLIVDEIQNIERVANEGDLRAKVLYDTLIEFRHNISNPITILAGPRIESLKTLGLEIFGKDKIIDEEKTKDSPVASITYAIAKKKNNFYFEQYCESVEKPRSIKLCDSIQFNWYGKSEYTEDYYKFLGNFTSNMNSNSTNIIFAPTSDKAVDIIQKIANQRPLKNNKELDSLSRYIKLTVNPNYNLSEVIKKGVAYHHGKMPMHIRSVIEYAVQKNMIDDIACTTTLMQGVNLPVQNIIIRNPHLKIRKNKDGIKPQLTNYEIANLRGRAGRLLKDFIGRTYIMDSSAFTPDEKTQTLFPETEKELSVGYGEQYNYNKNKIDNYLFEGKTIDISLERGSEYIITYIRYMILRYGEQAIYKLGNVGINITSKEISIAKEVLDNLFVDKEICLKNRYWDPCILNKLYLNRENFSLPTGVASRNIDKQLQTAMSI